jgi:hypothetical protein
MRPSLRRSYNGLKRDGRAASLANTLPPWPTHGVR